MRRARTLASGSHRRVVALVSTGVLAVSGVTLLGVGVNNQAEFPEAQPLAVNSPAAVRPVATQAPEVAAPVLSSSAPRSIAIPAIGVRSRIQRLGLTSDGVLEVPTPGPHYDEAGWFRHSPTPGALGPAIIAGHVDSATTGPSVFFRLGDLHARDRVRVTRADGTVAIFEVDSVRRYRKARFPTDLVYGNTDHAALRLITCGGPLDRAGHYRDNVVVLASLVGSADL